MKAAHPSLKFMQQAIALHQKGEITEAERLYRKVLSLNPRHLDALRLLGGLSIQCNKSESAVGYLRTALGIAPNHPELHTNLGVALCNLGKLDDALQHYQTAVTLAPDYADAIDNLGNLLLSSSKLDEAVTWFQRSLQLRPDYPSAHVGLAHAFRLQDKPTLAIAHYRYALGLLPDQLELMTHLGNLLRNTGQSAEALAIYQRVVMLRPDDATIQLNLGVIYRDVGQLPEALRHYEIALRLRPDYVDGLINRAGVLIELDRPEEAVVAYDQSLQLAPERADAQWGKSLALLMQGEYRQGWELYEARFAYKLKESPLPAGVPRWDGRMLAGQDLLIWGEQGLGDVLQFIRYAKLCKTRVGRVTVLCKPALQRLLAACPFIDAVITEVSIHDFAAHVPVMSLPYIFGTMLESIPAEVPYLFVSEEARQQWSPFFAEATGRKIGVVWAGNPRKSQIDAHVIDRQRSANLAMMKPLFEMAGCTFYNLQKDATVAEITAAGVQDRLVNFMPQVKDMMDTAAIIAQLDLVISVDTSVVHLAGGLGKPVWVLSRFGGCWRWLRNQERNPWYPTARVFGQATPGDWGSCLSKVGAALIQQTKP